MRSLLLAALLLSPPPSAADDAVERVRAALKAERWKDAVEAGRDAVAKEPESSEAHHWLGKAYGLSAKHASLVGRVDLAKKCGKEFEKAVALDETNLDAALDLVTFDVKAPSFLGGSRAKARALAARIYGRSPARGHVALAILGEEAKDRAGAEREYREAFALAPHDRRVLNALVDFLVAARRVEDALEVCRAALASDPEDEEARSVEKELLARRAASTGTAAGR